MPAIHLARLKLQAAHLRDSFSRPEAFVRGFTALLDFYADHTHRPGMAGKPPPLITTYHVPTQVIRQIVLELTSLIVAEPAQAIVLSDRLYLQPNLECKLLSATILGAIPLSHADLVIDRVVERIFAESEDPLVDALLMQGLTRLRREAVDRYLDLIDTWIHSESIKEKRIGLRALHSLLGEATFHNLPLFYRLLLPLVRALPATLRTEVLDVLKALAHRSPVETAFFLRQNLEFPGGTDIAWLSRQVLLDLTPEARGDLQSALREAAQKREL